MSVLQPLDDHRRMQAQRTWAKTPFRELGRTHWLIVGYGPIGQALAERVKAFGAAVTVVRRTPSTDGPVDRSGTMDDLPSLLPDADVVVIAAPLTPVTQGLFDATMFAAMRPGSILVNVARGGLVVTQDLVTALDAGSVGTAILDVFEVEPLPADSPLWAHPNVRLTPHTSFAGDGVQDRWDALFLENLTRFAAGHTLLREVDPAEI